MSAQSDINGDSLTGVWNGVYSYPDDMEPGEFTATLLQFGQTVSGSIHEPDLWDCSDTGLLFAEVSGRREGSRIEFAKTYDGAGGWSHTVLYAGELSPDGLEIEGVWDIPGHVAGRFLMMRAGREAAQQELAATDAIER